MLQQQGPDFHGAVGEGLGAEALGAEEDQAQTDQGHVQGHGDDQQYQGGGFGDGLEHQAVEQGAQGHDDAQGEQDLQGQGEGRQGFRLQAGDQAQQHQGQAQVAEDDARQALQVATLEGQAAVDQDHGDAEDDGQPHRARQLAGLDGGQGEGAVGDEFALGQEDHPGDGEHQHQGQGQQGVDGAVGEAVLAQEQKNLQIHECFQRRGPRGRPGAGGWLGNTV